MSSRGVSIWSHPEPGKRRPRFSRQQIAASALAIADREGFEAVSMRRIAADLGAGAMSLYRYVRTKDDLVDLMDDAVMGELVVPDGEFPAEWRAAVTLVARRTRDAFLRHPWAAGSLQRAVPGPNALRHAEQSLAALAKAPFTAVEKLQLLALVDDLVVGHAIRATESRSRISMDEAQLQEAIDLGTAELHSGRYPEAEALFGGGNQSDLLAQVIGPENDAARFERGLAAILADAAGRAGSGST
jgi:AcrR family transcriptional regulator